ncbi:MAG TPA: glycosyltransferase [Candidatus Elarobacter sp.]|jgi:glycosyltransferase involved in cell wall biosynthesis|nr:glycosyltransferase [Candidatus Elarobacter sp.]
MRVVHVCGDLGLYGAENVVALLMQHTREPDVELFAMTVYKSRHPEARERVGVPVIAIDRDGRKDWPFLFRMVRALRRLRPDVVHTHGHHGRYWGRLAAVLAGVPLIVHTEHNPDLTPPEPRWVFSGLNRLLNPRTAAFIDFTARRREELAQAEAIPIERIVVIPNGIPPVAGGAERRARGRAALGLAPGELGIAVVARLFEQKRQDLAIDAVAALPAELRARARLLLIGDGPLRGALEARAAAAGIADAVRFLGFRTDARELLAGADVALLTSAREAMPLAIIEAMLEGVPIVSTPWAGAGGMLSEGRFGLIAADFTGEAIAAVLREALENPDAASARADAALAYAQNEYDVGTQARRYAALYRDLSARTRAAKPLITAARS